MLHPLPKWNRCLVAVFALGFSKWLTCTTWSSVVTSNYWYIEHGKDGSHFTDNTLSGGTSIMWISGMMLGSLYALPLDVAITCIKFS